MLMSSENEYQERILDEGMMIMMRVNLSYTEKSRPKCKENANLSQRIYLSFTSHVVHVIRIT